MDIIVNGETRSVPAGHTISDLVTDLAVGARRIAIEVNQEIVPRSAYDRHALKPGDRVEVVTAIGGG